MIGCFKWQMMQENCHFLRFKNLYVTDCGVYKEFVCFFKVFKEKESKKEKILVQV